MKKVFFPNLDGLRFIAFFAVFLAHSFYSKNPVISCSEIYQTLRSYGHLGMFGVNFFFVLSGFLITYLLFLEQSESGKVNLRNFYVRRILRIWPLYYIIIIIGFFVIPVFQRQLFGLNDYNENANIWHYVFFINNFSSEIPTSAVLGILWSIAVEEQFYLVWPIFVKLIPSKKLPFFFILIIVVSSILRMNLIGYGYMHTFSCMSDLAMGSLFAYYSFYSNKLVSFFEKLPFWQIAMIYIFGISLFFIRRNWSDIPLLYLNERVLYSIFFAFVILEQNYSASRIKVSKIPLFSSLGKISYGLYMLHFIAIYLVSKILYLLVSDTLLTVIVIEPVISLLLSIVISFLSYNFIEKHFLRLKKYFLY